MKQNWRKLQRNPFQTLLANKNPSIQGCSLADLPLCSWNFNRCKNKCWALRVMWQVCFTAAAPGCILLASVGTHMKTLFCCILSQTISPSSLELFGLIDSSSLMSGSFPYFLSLHFLTVLFLLLSGGVTETMPLPQGAYNPYVSRWEGGWQRQEVNFHCESFSISHFPTL